MQETDEAVAYDVCTGNVDSNMKSAMNYFITLKRFYGEQQLVDLIAVTGTYVTVAMLLSLGEEPIPEGKPLPFPEKVKS
jgi:4-carboxymuconolactone decarboxylase